jgi:hypothetical protein
MTIYPLEQLLTIKKNRFDQAVKILEEKKALLEKAQAKLAEATKERDEALRIKQDKLTKLRAAMDEGQPTNKIQQMKDYQKIVQEKLLEKEKKVQEQQKQVDLAQKQVEIATQDMYQKKKDLEKIELHKDEWLKEAHYIIEQQAAVEHDEIGAASHTVRKQEVKRRKKK